MGRRTRIAVLWAAVCAEADRLMRRTRRVGTLVIPRSEPLEPRQLLSGTPPVIDTVFWPSAPQVEGDTASWNLSFSDSDSTNGVYSGFVDWGDGSAPEALSVNGGTYGSASGSHHYVDDGIYGVAVTIIDDGGESAVSETSLTFYNVQPSLNVGLTNVSEGLAASLWLSATDPGSDTINHWRVDWGDGTGTEEFATNGAGTTETHIYAEDTGNLSMTVWAVDEDGTYSIESSWISVAVTPPDITLGGDLAPAEGSPFTLSYSATDPGDDTITAWTVDWGDGTSEAVSELGVATHTYTDGPVNAGISMIVADEDGTFTGYGYRDVADVPPTLSLGYSYGVEGVATGLALAATDPGTDTITSWVVDWDDGNTETFANSGTGGVTPSHVYAVEGGYSVGVSAFDEDGGHSSYLSLFVYQGTPSFYFYPSGSPSEGEVRTASFGANVGRADSWYVEWGDGSTDFYYTPSGLATHTYADANPLSLTGITLSATAYRGSLSYAVYDAVETVAVVGPQVSLSGNYWADEGSPYSLSFSATDPGDDTITQWTIDWGDGTSADTIAAGNEGGVAAHTYTDGSTVYSVSVLAYDEDYTSGLGVTVGLEARDVAPSINLTGFQTVDEGSSYQVSFSATDPGTDTITAWTVNWDNTENHGFSNGSEGTTDLYTPHGASFTFAVTAFDEEGSYTSAPVVVTVTPNHPNDFAVTPVSWTQAHLSWTESSSVASGFVLTRATDAAFTEDVVTTNLSVETRNYSDTGLTPNITYYYALRAVNGETLSSAATGQVTLSVSPTDLTVQNTTSSTALLTWTPPPVNAGLTYVVFRNNVQIGESTATAFTDTGLSPNTAYTYVVWSKWPTGDLASASAATVGTTLVAPFDITPPPVPTNVHASATTDKSLTIDWSYSGEAATFQLYMDDAVVGFPVSESSQQIKIPNLTPATSYSFYVVATDALGNSSKTTAVQISTAADSTVPSKPLSLAIDGSTPSTIHLIWAPSGDNVGVVNYQVERSIDGGLYSPLGTTTTAGYLDSSLGNHTYSYKVIAKDAAGKESIAAMSPSFNPTTKADLDSSPYQYIPDSFIASFRDQFTSVFRDRWAQAGIAVSSGIEPAASGWLDIDRSGSTDTLIYGGKIVEAPTIDATGLHPRTGWVPAKAAFDDLNGNGVFDNGEAAWSWTDGDGTYQAGTSNLLTTNAPAEGTVGLQGFNAIDLNSNQEQDSDEPALIADLNRVHRPAGTSAEVAAFRDINGSGVWDENEPIWKDSFKDNIYQSDETILYGTGLVVGMLGKTTGLNIASVATAGTENVNIVWVDHTTFRQDFAAAYQGIDALISTFSNPDRTTDTKPFSWTVGDILHDIHLGTPEVDHIAESRAGYVSVTAESGLVTGEDTAFTRDLVAGDSILLGAKWYTVASIQSDTSLYVQSYHGDDLSAAPYSTASWTKVPTVTSQPGSPNLIRISGRPNASSAIFKQQFTELYGALNLSQELLPVYDIATFDSATSDQMITLVKKVAALYRAAIGTTELTAIEERMKAHAFDPGSIRRWGDVATLRSMVDDIASSVYIQDSSGQWRLPQGQPDSTTPLKFGDDEMRAELLPEIDDTRQRTAGSWLTDVPADFDPTGTAYNIDPVALDELEHFASEVEANEVWLLRGNVSVATTEPTSTYGVPYEYPYDVFSTAPWEVLPSISNWTFLGTSSQGATSQVGLAATGSSTLVEVELRSIWIGMLNASGSLSASAIIKSIQLPDDRTEGTPLSQIAIGPSPFEVDSSEWQWGVNETLLDIPESDIRGVIEDHWPPTAPSAPSSYLETSGTTDIDGLTWTVRAYSGQIYGDYVFGDGFVRVDFDHSLYPTEVGVFGKADPVETDYTAAPGPPAPATLTVPVEDLASSTQLDLMNVQSDSGLDGIVQVDSDQTSFGNDTGSINYQLRQDLPQSVLPLDVMTAALPIHAYLTSGAFGESESSIGTLRSTEISGPNVSEKGSSWAYSLNTHVRNNLLLIDSVNQVKRVEVVRPGGNVAVFNFGWLQADSTDADGHFRSVGFPVGTNQRDANQLYVLRDLTPQDNTDLSYELQFASGITHVFGSSGVSGAGGLISVKDETSGLKVDFTVNAPPAVNFDDPSNPDVYHSFDRYDVHFNWSAGRLSSVDYRTKAVGSGGSASPQTITTTIGYDDDSGDVISLAKANGTDIAAFKYVVENDRSITHAGSHVSRTGTLADGTITFLVESDDATGSGVQSVITLNSQQLPHTQVNTLIGGVSTDAVTTTWEYIADTGRFANGAPLWGKVDNVTSTNGSWVKYGYDGFTGWITDIITPDHNSTLSTADSTGARTQYAYTNVTGAGGDVADPSRLVARPRTVISTIAGTEVGRTLSRYASTTVDPDTTVTSEAVPVGTTSWHTPGALISSYTAFSYDAYELTTPDGKTTVTRSTPSGGAGGGGAFLTYETKFTPIGSAPSLASSSTVTINRFGQVTQADSTGPGATPSSAEAKDSGDTDAFGRILKYSVAGQPDTTINFGTEANSWFGPASVTNADGSTSSFEYNTTGSIHTATVSLQPKEGVTLTIATTYQYDAAGHVLQAATAGRRVDTTGAGEATVQDLDSSVSSTFDTRGRIKTYTDEVNNTTSYDYFDSGGSPLEVTTTYADSSYEKDTYRLDGSLAKVEGTAVYPSTADHGVVTTAIGPKHIGDTWSLSSSNDGKNTTKTFYNPLGQAYLTEQSSFGSVGTSPTVSTATAEYDGNSRASKSVDFDGTWTVYQYAQGMSAATLKVDHTQTQYQPGVDRKTLTKIIGTPTGTSVDAPGIQTLVLSNTGLLSSQVTTTNHGLSSSSTVNDQTDTSQAVLNANGTQTLTSAAADGTKIVDQYRNGLLVSEVNYAVDGTTIISQVSQEYDALGRVESVNDHVFGPTVYERRKNGQVSKVTLPDNRTTVYDNFDAKTNAPKATTQADSTTQNQALNTQGQATSSTGPGTIPLAFGYHAKTGQQTSLTTARSGLPTDTSNSTKATTQWEYDDATGILKKKTWADGSIDEAAYNSKFQLDYSSRPGVSTDYQYNELTGEFDSSFTEDLEHGNITDEVASRDDLGRPLVWTQLVAGHTATASTAYTARGELKLDLSGDTGAGTVYAYYGPSENTNGASPGALQSITLKKGATILKQEVYKYDSATKRLESLTLKLPDQPDQVFTYHFKSETNIVDGVTGNGVYTHYTYETTNPRLQNVQVIAPEGVLYDATFGYNPVDQRSTEAVSYTSVGGGTVAYNGSFVYDTEEGEISQPIGALTSATRNYTSGGLSNESYEYAYDNVGNRTSGLGLIGTTTDFSQTSSFNNLNQIIGLGYDARGNLLSDGTHSFGWDAADRLTTVDTSILHADYAYDPDGRRVEKKVYAVSGATRTLDTTASRRFAWAGGVVVAEFDLSNHLLTSYAWSPLGGLLAVTDHRGTTPITYRVIQDGTGSVVGLIAPDGTVAATYRYDPYGRQLEATGPAADVCNYRFAGGYRDAEDGLQDHLHRYYSPEQGRWLSRDPIAEAGGVNVYGYCGGDPVNETDFDGCAPDDGRSRSRGVPTNLKPPPDMPELVTYRYSEQEWKQSRIVVGETRDFGRWTYIAVATGPDPEGTLSVASSNVGSVVGNLLQSGAAVVTWSPIWGSAVSLPKGNWTRSRRDYVDVIFHLSYRHYSGAVDNFSKVGSDNIFITNYANLEVSHLSVELNDEYKYFYLEQFGGAVAAEVIGGVIRLRAEIIDANAVTGTAQARRAANTYCFPGDTLVHTAKKAKMIQNVGLGDRVLTPQTVDPYISPTLTSDTLKSKSYYRIILKKIVEANDDEMEVELLRDELWVKQHRAYAGGFIDLSIDELGVYGPAAVVAIEPTVAPTNGVGRIVRGIFRRTSDRLIEFTFHGVSDIVRVTPGHLFWSVSQKQWVAAERFKVGGLMLGRSGELRIRDVREVLKSARVFNIEVDVEHCYFVASAGILCHNASGFAGKKPLTADMIMKRDCWKDAKTIYGKMKSAGKKATVWEIRSKLGKYAPVGQVECIDGTFAGVQNEIKNVQREKIWDNHRFVVVEEPGGLRVYDNITGPSGMPLDEYKGRWKDASTKQPTWNDFNVRAIPVDEK